MLTLETKGEFEKNANQTGVQQFRCLRRETDPNGKNVYLYQRTHTKGEKMGMVFAYEVFVPSVKKAGTYPFPNGRTITYEEDFEEYPGASKFGFSAWFFDTLPLAEQRFQDIVAGTMDLKEVESNEVPESLEPKHHGRSRIERPALLIPVGEFSTKELAEQNSVEYSIACMCLKDLEMANLVMRTRTEKRNAGRGKPTQLFAKIL